MTAVSIHKQILDAVRDTIAAQALDGLEAENIKVAWFPVASKLKEAGQIGNLPAILVSPYGSEGVPFASSTQDDYGYPCFVAIVAATDQNLVNHIDKYLTWRETVVRALHNQRLSGVSEVWRTTVAPGAISDWSVFQASGYWASYFTVTATARLTRP